MMQEENTNNGLKAEPVAFECDLFSSVAPLWEVFAVQAPIRRRE